MCNYYNCHYAYWRPSDKRFICTKQIMLTIILFQTTARLKKERPVRTALVSIPFAIVTTVTVDVRVKYQVTIYNIKT